MKLIADSGSTKTAWIRMDDDGNFESCYTTGINPFMMSMDEIQTLLDREFSLPTEGYEAVFYYGAGALPGKKELLVDLFRHHFNPEKVEVHSDLVGAARSLCQHSPGIACILGTGSNSCYYDGREVAHNVSPLGYVLGDEGSGAFLGKTLVADVLKNQLPEEICRNFYETYQVTAGDIIEQVYRKPFPNRYLAQYTHFLSRNIQLPEIASLVEKGFQAFFTRNVLQYEQTNELPVHFTGSVAFVFREILEKVALRHNLRMGTVTKEPMEGLIRYHQTN